MADAKSIADAVAKYFSDSESKDTPEPTPCPTCGQHPATKEDAMKSIRKGFGE